MSSVPLINRLLGLRAGGDRQEPAWIAVQEWNGGHGRITTDSFKPASRPWRVSFKATGGERWGILNVFVRTTDRKHVGSAVNMHLMAFDEAQRSGTLVVDSDGEGYVVEIVSDNISWHVMVERRQ